MTETLDKKKAEGGESCVDNPPKIETFDDILPHIGEAGRYQWFLFFLLLPFTIVYAFLYFAQFFITLIPEEYWCRVPEFENSTLTDWEKIHLSVPDRPYIETETNLTYSRCTMYITNYTKVLLTGQKPGPDTPIAKCQSGWSFNQSNVPYLSIAAELEWVCDQAYLGSAAQSAFFVGSIVGGLIFGYIADHYGRLPALVACNGVGFFASIATAFCNSFWTFAAARFVVGTSFDNCFNIIFIIVIEYVGPKYRTLMANMSFGIYFAFASSILPWIAYWVSNWKILSAVAALPLVVAFVTPWIVPESARWYIQNGKVDKAIEMLKKFEKVNRKSVAPQVYEEFEKSCNTMIKNDKSNNNYTVLDLFKLPRLGRITVVLVIYWLLMVLVFDGHVWNMKLLHPDVFTSFSLASITELPAAILLALFLDRWGRRWMGFFSMLICGIFSYIAIAMPIGAPAMTMAILARLGVNISANIGFQYAAEMLPTVVRAQGVSLIHIIGYFAHIIGPYVVYLANFHKSLPLIVLGTLSLIDAALTLTLPETMDQELPESLEEGNDFGRQQSFWWFPCIKRSPEKKKKYRKTLAGATNAGFNPGSLQRIESTRL
ncbi:organic cation transporter protein-like [Phymastichus coffea]|uniref:organic cation transporter protein-like n=1 Tax=Phymastichus coffea TaxID=108790 RepID=UPI00273C3079|nr:organic cation transporter protein-like [Phymastichus coffea]XP_058789015.1 organic cation transporter protein-like [Phymastichus coffea]XP_058789016.1 organic cation transporter protein-like [Phymastichus coffea]XP_058789017.1 organic cation transporter protein-like [Phymastichus coffea]XP_058789018.1 organic cation transporter protein-like [Phymastichus coffea]